MYSSQPGVRLADTGLLTTTKEISLQQLKQIFLKSYDTRSIVALIKIFEVVAVGKDGLWHE